MAQTNEENNQKVQRPVIIERRKRATHFFAVQISDSQIVESVRSVQSVIVEREPRLKNALVEPSTFHITLAVFHLATPQEHTEASRVLLQVGNQFIQQQQSLVEGFNLKFGKVGHFDKKVIFASLHPEEEDNGEEHLTNISKCLMESCKRAGIHLVDDRFKPHLTLLKLSKDPKLWKKGMKTVPSELYKSHLECIRGTQVVKSIQFLSMTEPNDPVTGYYTKKGEFHFGRPSSST